MPPAEVTPQTISEVAPHSRLPLFIAAAVAAFLLLAASLYGAYSWNIASVGNPSTAAIPVNDASNTPPQAPAVSAAPAVSSDVHAAASVVNPSAATNPFNDPYQNPFQ